MRRNDMDALLPGVVADSGNMGTNGVLRIFCLREKAVSLQKISGTRQYGSKLPLRSFAVSLQWISESDRNVFPKQTISNNSHIR